MMRSVGFVPGAPGAGLSGAQTAAWLALHARNSGGPVGGLNGGAPMYACLVA
jgi:hypothetical protein